MEKPPEQRYLFDASAVALGGYIRRPFDEVIESQASAVLPITGGYGRSRVDNFKYRNIASFSSAYSTVAGNESCENGKLTYNTLTTVTVEGLNVSDIVTADAVVARLTSEFDAEKQHQETVPVGSHFINLRIAGVRVEPEPRGFLFESGDLPKLTDACQSEPDLSALAGDLVRLQSGSSHGEASPMREGGPIAPRKRQVVTSLFAIPEKKKLPPGCFPTSDGGIRVPGFGTVYVSEFYITRSSRRLSMLRIEMGCPVDGTLTVDYVAGGGSTHP